MEITIKRFKSFRGNEGIGFNADLHFDGKKIVEVDDAANGGEYSYYFVSQETEQQFDVWHNSLPLKTSKEIEAEWREILSEKTPENEAEIKRQVTKYPNGQKIDRDIAVYDLIEDFEEERRLKRIAKTRLIFRVKNEKDWRSLKNPYSEAAVKWVRDKYGLDVEIYNEQ